MILFWSSLLLGALVPTKNNLVFLFERICICPSERCDSLSFKYLNTDRRFE